MTGSESKLTPNPAEPSADPMSPNFSYDCIAKDFFGGNFFSQMLSHTEPKELLDAIILLP